MSEIKESPTRDDRPFLKGEVASPRVNPQTAAREPQERENTPARPGPFLSPLPSRGDKERGGVSDDSDAAGSEKKPSSRKAKRSSRRPISRGRSDRQRSSSTADSPPSPLPAIDEERPRMGYAVKPEPLSGEGLQKRDELQRRESTADIPEELRRRWSTIEKERLDSLKTLGNREKFAADAFLDLNKGKRHRRKSSEQEVISEKILFLLLFTLSLTLIPSLFAEGVVDRRRLRWQGNAHRRERSAAGTRRTKLYNSAAGRQQLVVC